jgi:hypothetical protein
MLYADRMTYDGGLDFLITKRGLSLAHIAHATGHTMSRVRTWRRGTQMDVPAGTIESLDRFAAFLDRLDAEGSDEPINELDLRLVPGYTVVGWDLYDEGELDAIVDIVNGNPADVVLDRAIPDWRTRFDTRYEVFEASDGVMSIKMK